MAEFAQAKTASVSMKVDMTESGLIKQSGETKGGAKAFTLPGIKAAATLAEAEQVYGLFYGTICGGTYDSLSAVKTYKVGVSE